jgi:aminomethyltransferase
LLRKSPFFDFFNRRDESDFASFMANSIEDEHYINWNGFALPHDYGDAEFEYRAIRNNCAIFDVSPIRKIRVQGNDAGTFFDHLLTRPVGSLPAMRATYTVFCNDNGSLKDDAILYKFDDDDYLLMPSDVDHSPYFESLSRQLELQDVSFMECTDSWFGMAIQGPLSAAALLNMGFDGVEQIRPFEVRDYSIAGKAFFVSRMGFTADLGYECWFVPELVDTVLGRIHSARSALNIAMPGYGLSALQACRLEGGFIVAGWDCSTELDPIPDFERSPYELGLGWLVNLDAVPFVGRDALALQKKNGHRFTLRSFVIDKDCNPDDGAELFDSVDAQNESIGKVACSNWSWGMNKTIGNASINAEHANVKEAWVVAAGEYVKLTLSRGPLVTLERRNQVPAPTATPD